MIELGATHNIEEGKCTVMGYKDKENIFVRLEDGSDLTITFCHLKRGGLSKANLIRKRLRSIWAGIHARCGKHENYLDCTVHTDWTRFDNFYVWAVRQVGHDRQDFEIDKDILIQSNREYGPLTCCFVPCQINQIAKIKENKGLPIGVQKYKNKFVARFSENGKTKTVGVFDTPEIASMCYKTNKLRIIKNIAERYRLQIDIKVYIAIQNYEIQTS